MAVAFELCEAKSSTGEGLLHQTEDVGDLVSYRHDFAVDANGFPTLSGATVPNARFRVPHVRDCRVVLVGEFMTSKLALNHTVRIEAFNVNSPYLPTVNDVVDLCKRTCRA